MRSLQLQAAVTTGARPRLPVENLSGVARARPDWNLQPLLLPRGAGGAGPSRIAQPRTSAGFQRTEQEILGAALRIDQCSRTSSGVQRNGNLEVLPSRVERGAEEAIAGETGRSQ